MQQVKCFRIASVVAHFGLWKWQKRQQPSTSQLLNGGSEVLLSDNQSPTSYCSATAHCHCLGLPWEFGAYLSVKTYRLSDIDTYAHDVHAFLGESPKKTPLCPWKHMKTKSSDKYQSPGGSYPPFWSSRANISEFIFNKYPALFNRQSASLYTTYIPLSSHFLVGFWGESSLNIGESIGKVNFPIT